MPGESHKYNTILKIVFVMAPLFRGSINGPVLGNKLGLGYFVRISWAVLKCHPYIAVINFKWSDKHYLYLLVPSKSVCDFIINMCLELLAQCVSTTYTATRQKELLSMM